MYIVSLTKLHYCAFKRQTRVAGWRPSLHSASCGRGQWGETGSLLIYLFIYFTQNNNGSFPRSLLHHLNSSSLCAFLGHVDMWNGDSLAIGEGAQQMPVHHGPSYSRGLSAAACAAVAAACAQPAVTPSHHHNHPFSPHLSGLAPDGFSQGSMAPLQTPDSPSHLACSDRWGSRRFPTRSVLSEHI